MTEPKRLTDSDWETLLPSESVTIAEGVSVRLQPMGIADIWVAVRLVYNVFDHIVTPVTEVLKNQEDTQDMIARVRQILTHADVLNVLQREAPELLERATGIHREDLRKMPPAPFSKLMIGVADINLKSHEELSKNLGCLADRLKMIRQGPDTGGASVKPSSI